MPELPEIEIVKRSLLKMVNNAKITSVKILNKNLRYKIHKTFSNQLKNQKILKIIRKSKYLIFYFKRKMLLIHLGMTGKLILMNRKNKILSKTSFYYDLNILPKHNHIFFILNNNITVIYNDVRRFGFLKIFEHTNLNKIKFLNKLGPEPLGKSFSFKYFKNFIINKKKILRIY